VGEMEDWMGEQRLRASIDGDNGNGTGGGSGARKGKITVKACLDAASGIA
jgi:hypothetical protein